MGIIYDKKSIALLFKNCDRYWNNENGSKSIYKYYSKSNNLDNKWYDKIIKKKEKIINNEILLF